MIRCIKRTLYKELQYLLNYWKWRTKVIFDRTNYIGKSSTFEGANRLASKASFIGTLGYGSYIGHRSYLDGNIGRFCSIAPDVHVNRGVHPLNSDFATLSPMFYSTSRIQTGVTFAKKQMFNENKPPITIGNDCWIGQGVFISGGITIGDGAVVLAGATVVSDIPPYAIVGGTPAKIIKYRYDKDTIDYLLRIKWWNKDLNWLKENWELLTDINKLKSTII